ncbi:MAG: HAD family hydrolase [Pseudomonadota bacterium]
MSAPPELPRAIRGVIFDKDGTLFDFRRTWGAWTAGFIRDLAKGDTQAASALADAFHYDVESQEFAPTSPVIAGTMDVIVDAIRLSLPHMTLEEVHMHVLLSTSSVTQVEAVPLRPLMDELRAADLTLGLATNDAEKAARSHLETRNILEHFAFVAGYDSGHGAKPAPGMLKAFCAQTGIPPEACIMVGDSSFDLESGRAAGMRTIGVLTGLATTPDLSHLADAILPDIGALPAWLRAQSAGRPASEPLRQT